ncbi:cysteine hydrolase family protein [Streptomyces sp. DT24]|uniref:cysteine hydrolase family protein n=1 Tax=Streptomyces sp. DT24 TaxID=3416520 RepID=UPI003CE7CAA7
MSIDQIFDDPYTAPRFASAALITIDVQRDFLSEAPYGVAGTTEALPRIREVVSAFRTAQRPVVHIVRLYDVGGGNAEPSRRRLLESGVDLAAPGTPGSQLAEGMAPAGAAELDVDLLKSGRPQELGPHEFVLFKPRWGAFYRTGLDELLRARGVDTLVFAGCNLPNCPRASVIEACERDYRVVLVPDAVSRATEVGLAEISGLGVHLVPVAELIGHLPGRAPTP